MHFERFKVHSRAQSASTNRTGFGVFLWCSSCLGQSTGEMPARHLSLSLSLSHSRSLPPSLSFSLPLSLSIPGRYPSISHGTAKQLVQCKSPRARRRAGGIAIPNGKCRGSGILRLSSAEAALPIPDDSDSADYETQSLHVCGNSWHQTGHAR